MKLSIKEETFSLRNDNFYTYFSYKKFLGPFPWPVVGNTYYFQKLSKRLGGSYFAFLELSKQYNSDIISLRLGTSDTIVVSNYKLIQEMLSKKEYQGRPWNEFIKIRNMGMKRGNEFVWSTLY